MKALVLVIEIHHRCHHSDISDPLYYRGFYIDNILQHNQGDTCKRLLLSSLAGTEILVYMGSENNFEILPPDQREPNKAPLSKHWNSSSSSCS